MAKDTASLKEVVKSLEERMVSLEKEFAVFRNNFRWSIAALILFIVLMASPDSVIFKVIKLVSDFRKALP